MKTVILEFEPGQNVDVMKNSHPVSTKIRAVNYHSSMETARDAKTGQETSRIVERVSYSTFADPNVSLPASKIGSSREDLMKKVFGSDATIETDETKSAQKK